MSRDELKTSQIIGLLPHSLQLRFNSLNRYIRGVIEEEEDKLGRTIELSDEDVQLIQLAAFIYLLDDFLRTGTHAAREAALTFEEFGLDGFQIGSTFFTRNNENTLRGELLADHLRSTLANTPLARHIKTAPSMRILISTLISESRNGEIVD